jgi:hypothetical protein
MKGCIKLFPRSIAASQCEAALDKARTGKLSSWDERMLKAIEQLKAGSIDVRALEAVAQGIKLEKLAWMKRKGYRR